MGDDHRPFRYEACRAVAAVRHVICLPPFPNQLLFSVEQTLLLSIAVELLVEVIHKAENMPVVGMRVFESTRI